MNIKNVKTGSIVIVGESRAVVTDVYQAEGGQINVDLVLGSRCDGRYLNDMGVEAYGWEVECIQAVVTPPTAAELRAFMGINDLRAVRLFGKRNSNYGDDETDIGIWIVCWLGGGTTWAAA